MSNSSEEDVLAATIQMCPEEEQIPYTMIPNALLRDATISPNCIWLICYLLSNAPGWVIKIPQVINHVKKHLGRDSVYKILEEAINAGYIKKQYYLENNLKRCKYFISRSPKFKKFLRHPDPQDAGHQNAGGPDCKEEQYKEKQVKQQLLGSEAPGAVEMKEEKKNVPLVKDDVHAYCIRGHYNWSSDEIDQAYDAYSKAKNPITEPYEYIKAIINKKRTLAQAKNKGKIRCQTTTKQTSKSKFPDTNTTPTEGVGFSEQFLAMLLGPDRICKRSPAS